MAQSCRRSLTGAIEYPTHSLPNSPLQSQMPRHSLCTQRLVNQHWLAFVNLSACRTTWCMLPVLQTEIWDVESNSTRGKVWAGNTDEHRGWIRAVWGSRGNTHESVYRNHCKQLPPQQAFNTFEQSRMCQCTSKEVGLGLEPYASATQTPRKINAKRVPMKTCINRTHAAFADTAR